MRYLIAKTANSTEISAPAKGATNNPYQAFWSKLPTTPATKALPSN